MQINNLHFLNRISEADLARLRVGQHLEVEVISHEANQDGVIALGGKIMRAKIEAQVQTGERFWAAVKEANEDGIVLSRDFLNNAKLDGLSKEQVIVLVNRGFNFDPLLSETLTKFAKNKETSWFRSLASSENADIRNLLSSLIKIFPHWSKLNQANYSPLIDYFSHLGLENERMIYDKYRLSPNEGELSESDNVKLNLLKLLEEQAHTLSKEDKSSLHQLLDEITGQQLWIQSGVRKNAYCLLHLPLYENGELFPCHIAMESARKGTKMDATHSRIALQVETPHLGLVGADLMLFDDKMNVCFLHDDVEYMGALIEELYEEAFANFHLMGLTIERFSVRSFAQVPSFFEFLTGKHMGGVDIEG
jgi:hypothetical protein